MKFARTLLLFTAAVCFPELAEAGPFFVEVVDGHYTVSAVNTLDPNASDFGFAAVPSEILSQTSVTAGPLSGTATGVTRNLLDRTPLSQEADASLQGTATIGALHAVVAAASDSSGYGAGGGTSANAMLDLEWSDTVTFSVANPAGADFTAALVLDDVLSVSAGDGDYAASATTILYSSLSRGPPLLDIIDSAIENNGQDIGARAPADSVSHTFHVTDGQIVTFTGELQVNAFTDDTGSVAVDAADTAGFFLTTDDPTASYATASGARFDLPGAAVGVPEPSSAALLPSGLLLTLWWRGLALRRRRRVAAAAPCLVLSAAARRLP